MYLDSTLFIICLNTIFLGTVTLGLNDQLNKKLLNNM